MSHGGGGRVRPSPPWYIWYALRLGLPYAHALDLPHGELLDLIAVDQVKREGFEPVTRDERDIWEILEVR